MVYTAVYDGWLSPGAKSHSTVTIEYMFPFHQWCMVVVTGCQVASHSDNGIYVSSCMYWCRWWLTVTIMPIRLATWQWKICLSTANQTAITEKGRGHAANWTHNVKYPASSSYHLTRLVFMKTSSPRTFNAFLTLATTRRCSFATGGTFSNSRALLQSTATLTTMLLTRDARKGDHHSNGLCRFSLIWQWYAMPTSDTTGCF